MKGKLDVSKAAWDLPKDVVFGAERSMSVSGPTLTNMIREQVSAGVTTKPGSSATFMDPKLTSARHTLVLHPLTDFSPSIRSYIYSKLLDVWRLKELQKFGAINGHDMQEQAALADQAGRDVVCGIVAPRVSCPDSFSALLPFNVMGDGNCCLHAISVALWGIQDRVGVLRGALKGMMDSKQLFWRLRWTNQEKEWDASDAKLMGLDQPIDREDVAWASEWKDIQERSGTDGAYLTQIHLFVMAHVIRRPIIVFAHTEQDDSLCRFRGIYLPLEWPEEDCEKVPILLGYHQSHFVPLVYHLSSWPPKEEKKWPLVSLEVGDGTGMLPVLFSKGRPTRTARSEHGIKDMSPVDMVASRLPFEQVGGVSAIRMDLRKAMTRARRRMQLGDEEEAEMSDYIVRLIDDYIQQGRNEAVEFLAQNSGGVGQEDDEALARALQAEEEWNSQVQLSSRMGSFKLSSAVSPTAHPSPVASRDAIPTMAPTPSRNSTSSPVQGRSSPARPSSPTGLLQRLSLGSSSSSSKPSSASQSLVAPPRVARQGSPRTQSPTRGTSEGRAKTYQR